MDEMKEQRRDQELPPPGLGDPLFLIEDAKRLPEQGTPLDRKPKQVQLGFKLFCGQAGMSL
jgi:hypothetical protein